MQTTIITSTMVYILIIGAQALITYLAGSGPIYLDNVACSGSERTLAQCDYDSHTADCNHIEDAGVRCARKHTKLPHFSILNISISIIKFFSLF